MPANCPYSHIPYSTIETYVRCECECECKCECATNHTTGSVKQSRSYLETVRGGIQLSYHNKFSQDGAPSDPNFGFGTNWIASTQSYVTQTDDCGVVVIWMPDSAVWFDQSGPSTFVARHCAHETLTMDGSSYRVTSPDGTVHKFSQSTGKLEQKISPGGQVTQNSYDGSGKLQETLWSATVGPFTYDELWDYDYELGTEPSLVTTITLRRRVRTSPTAPWTDLRRIQLSYWTGAGSDFGNAGDLMMITLQEYKNSTWQTLTQELFRYYKDLEAGGHQHALKFVIGPETFHYMNEEIDFNPVTASDSEVAGYADMFYAFHTDRRVSMASAVGGTRTFEFAYLRQRQP